MTFFPTLTGSQKRYIFRTGFLLYDIITIFFSFYVALYVGYACELKAIPTASFDAFLFSIKFYLPGCILIYWLFRLYNSIWRLVSYFELFSFMLAVIVAVGIYYIVGSSFSLPLPRRYYVIGGWLQLWLLILCRFSYRLLVYLVVNLRNFTQKENIRRRAMMIGAGAAGQIILRDVRANDSADVKILCIIDDEPSKRHCNVCGVPVVGGRDDILFNVKKYNIEEILFAIPTISAKDKRDILNICQETDCKLRILPGICSLANGDVSIAKMREVTIEELLGREPVKVNTNEILNNLNGKVILVTGGGGSIGSELCRQIAKHQPQQLIILDIYENNAYDIEQELRYKYSDLNLTVLIGSVRDSKRIRQVFATYKPEIVFHAAAHKHVPLMEGSPCEAIKNNVLGTYKTACAAMLSDCKRFVLISTDKAVNPTNIMGASKRLCEMVIQTLDKVSRTGKYQDIPKFLASHTDEKTDKTENLFAHVTGRTEFVAVRFGNVLGSNGSVIPLFKKQIAGGGPVRVTHPDIIRYFMTIPEAVSLVLEAETYAKGGEIFVLDMGTPVKIDSLARNLIKLCGFIPDVDIEIEYSGLRPGEKLYEEKLMSEEGLEMTQNELIHIAKPLDWELKPFLNSLEKLARASYENQDDIFSIVASMVKTFKHSKP